MTLQDITHHFGTHQQKAVIWIKFPYDSKNIAWLKTQVKPRWSASQKSWYLPDRPANRLFLEIPLKTLGKQAIAGIHPSNMPQFYRFEQELQLRAYSSNTARTYCTEFAQLLNTIAQFPVQNLTTEKLRSYLLYCINTLKMSENQLHSRINAIKFYFEKILKKPDFFFDIPRPKKPQLLPNVLSQTEIKQIIHNTPNNKHRLILQLVYGMGLRVSEIINLKIEHINSHTMQVLIKAAKGKKDRYVNLPYTVLHQLREYYKEYRPQIYLFNGQYTPQYSIRSAQQIFKNALKRCNINKNIGIHGLRHSYATHLLDHGTDMSFIQKLLGHNNIKTTLIYAHISDRNIANVQSPLDYA
jgi:integrase/recombinase XerD